MKILLTRNKPENAKLMLVKCVKDLTGLGLKESKDIVDNLCSNPNSPNMVSIEISENSVWKKDKSYYDAVISFIRHLNENCSGSYSAFGRETDRELKMLDLGIGEKSDYIDFISKHLVLLKTREELENYLSLVLSKMDMSEISKLFTELKNELKQK